MFHISFCFELDIVLRRPVACVWRTGDIRLGRNCEESPLCSARSKSEPIGRLASFFSALF